MHELNANALRAYRSLFDDIPSGDEEGREEIWKPIQDFWDEMTCDAGAARSMRSIVSRMLSAKEQFTDLVSRR